MTDFARAWLPPGAFLLSNVERGLGEVLASWSRHWFGVASAAVSACRDNTPVPADCLTSDVAAGSLVLPPRGKRHLIEAALAIDLSDVELAEADRPVIDELADQIARDLLEQLGMTFDDALSDKSLAITVTLAGRELLTLQLPESGVARRVRAALPAARPSGALVSRRRALGLTEVTLDGLLGRGALTMRELGDLAVGDVILLRQPVAGKAQLRLAGSGLIIAAAVAGRSGDHPTLRL
jgi:hypothetical protein